MQPFPNISKITPPILYRVLDRPRLLNLLEQNRDKKLIIILGQAAQGKSTLAASYAKASDVPTAWINLDREDSDPVNLFYLMAQSLQRTFERTDFSPLFSCPMTIFGPRSEMPLYRDLSRSMFELVAAPVRFILDGLDQLLPSADSFRFLQALIENLPKHIRVVLISREIPPQSFEFQQLKMKQEAFILTNEDLAFNQDEVKQFFKKTRNMSFSEEQLSRISLAAEGWIGGLILLSESLSRVPEESRQAYVLNHLPGDFKKEVFQYFDKEIFSAQTGAVQEFLLQSSSLDFIDPPLVKELFGTENVKEPLRGLVRRNLFVHSLYDEKKGWNFRYHQLFKEFLRAKFESRTEEEERHRLFSRIGALYARKGDLESAVKYLLEAKAYSQAAALIAQLGTTLFWQGRMGDLSRWLQAFPEEFVQGNPWLLYWLALSRRFKGGSERVISLQKAHALFTGTGDQRGVLLSHAQLIAALIQTGSHLVPVKPLIEEGERLLASSDFDAYPYEKAIMSASVGMGHIFGEGDIRRGIQAYQNAPLISNQFRDKGIQAYAFTYAALGLIFLGEFPVADEMLKKIEKSRESDYHTEFRAVSLMVQCILASSRGELAKAQSLVEKLQESVEEHGYTYMYPWVLEITATLNFQREDFKAAEDVAYRYLNTARFLKNAFLTGKALRLLAELYLHQGLIMEAKSVLDKAMDLFSEQAPSTYEINKVRFTRALACLHLKEYDDAEKGLFDSLSYFSSVSGHNFLMEIHIATGLLHYDLRRRDEARQCLKTGFTIAEDWKYDYFITLPPVDVVKACVLTLKLNVEGAFEYASKILLKRYPSLAEAELKELLKQPAPEIRTKALETLTTLHRSKVPGIRVETLGGFQVFRGAKALVDREWDRSQPRQLLKALIAHGGQRIPKDLLIDDFWPDEKIAAGERDFKITLHRLRRILEPDMDRDLGSAYIHLRDNLLSLDSELCQVDVNEFLTLMAEGDEREKAGDAKTALNLYAEAEARYKGDFLADDLYPQWADTKREELKRKYIELLSKMASLHEKQGAFKKAVAYLKKVIEKDPLLEESYRSLMVLYSNMGMHNEALRTYEECKKILKSALQTEPDPMTTSLHKKIFEKNLSG
jgi:ATP/maltotriose-dependent transcriptional regulator MalT/DNA-binding SARP family transcriptional activator